MKIKDRIFFSTSQSYFFQIPTDQQRTILSSIITMASGRKRKGSLSLPDWVAESLDCPLCLKIIKDPPIYLCEKGHGLCSTCREQLKTEDKPCPVCRGKLTDTRNLAVENFLEKLPKIRCKYDGCTFERSDMQLVKNHEDEECREKPVQCRLCPESVAISKMVNHLETKHNQKSIGFTNLDEEWELWTTVTWSTVVLPLILKCQDRKSLAAKNRYL